MDQNKATKLAEIGYSLAGTCGTCEHSRFKGCPTFGLCTFHSYVHLKHGDERDLSIHVSGKCNNYQQSEAAIAELAHFVF